MASHPISPAVVAHFIAYGVIALAGLLLEQLLRRLGVRRGLRRALAALTSIALGVALHVLGVPQSIPKAVLISGTALLAVAVLVHVVASRRGTTPRYSVRAQVIVLGVVLSAGAAWATWYITGLRKFTSVALADVVVFSALDSRLNEGLRDAFDHASGLSAAFVTLEGSAVDVASRLRVAGRAPEADVFIGGPTEIHALLANEGLLEEFTPRGPIDTTSIYRSATWQGCWLNVLVFVVNPQVLPAGIRISDLTWELLGDPRLRGRIVLPDPSHVGAGYVYLATQVFRHDGDVRRARTFLQKVETNNPEYVPYGPRVIERVADGEKPVGIAWLSDVLRLRRDRGYAIHYKAPRDAGYEVGAVSMLRSASHPEAARRFVAFMLTPAAANVMAREYKRPLHLNGIQLPPEWDSLYPPRLDLVSYDHQQAARNMDVWTSLWTDIRSTK